ncbi:MAG: hypothetical protein Q4C60_06010 [Eubacteriales bacterium]|nr:hypothetical protein [Eubacteriales bacterium]
MLRKIVEKKTAVSGMILLLMAVLLLSVWPLRLWTEDVTLAGAGEVISVSEDVNAGNDVGESFTASYDHLQTIAVRVEEVHAGGAVNFRLFGLRDGQQALLAEETVTLRAGQLPGYVEIPLDVDLEPGGTYTYLLETDEAAFTVGYQAADGGLSQGLITEKEAPAYLGAFHHDTTVDGVALVSRFVYRMPLRKLASAGAMAVILAAGLLAAAAAQLFYRRYPERNRLLSLESVLRWTLTPFVVAAGAAAVIAVGPLQLFDRRISDILFYELGILLTTLLALYALWHDRTGRPPLLDREIILKNWKHWLQSVLIAAELAFCCEYMNALYDLQHTLAERKMAIAFLLVILVTYRGQELWNMINLVYVVPAVIISLVYYRTYALDAAQKEYEQHNLALRLGITALVLLGLVLINTARLLATDWKNRRAPRSAVRPEHGAGVSASAGQPAGRGKRRPSAPAAAVFSALTGQKSYLTVLTVLFAMLVILRNTRWWTVVLAAGYGLFYVRFAHWKGRSRWLTNVCRGVCLQFIAMVVYCLLHRYYMSFLYTRFSMDFHTVTITAAYLTVVEAAVFVLFLEKWRKQTGRPFRRIAAAVWKEAVLLGVASSYLLMTMSRTGVAAVGATALVLLIAMALGMRSRAAVSGQPAAASRHTAAAQGAEIRRGTQGTAARGTRWAALAVAAMAAATVAVFPMIFTAQRIIPAVVGEPKLFEIESYPDEVMRNRHWDSMYYICLERFGQVFGTKMFGLPEGSYDFYGDSQESAQAQNSAPETGESALAAGSGQPGQSPETPVLSVADSGLLVASAQETPPGTAAEDAGNGDGNSGAAEAAETADSATAPSEPQEGGDYTNGRLSIYRSYLEQLNLFGHDGMGATLEDGSTAVHAHNVFLQVAYDHGIFAGLWFALFLLLTFIRACLYYSRMRGERKYTLLPLAAVTAFGAAGMVEWVFVLCNPMTVLLFYAIAPLLMNFGKNK